MGETGRIDGPSGVRHDFIYAARGMDAYWDSVARFRCTRRLSYGNHKTCVIRVEEFGVFTSFAGWRPRFVWFDKTASVLKKPELTDESNYPSRMCFGSEEEGAWNAGDRLAVEVEMCSGPPNVDYLLVCHRARRFGRISYLICLR